MNKIQLYMLNLLASKIHGTVSWVKPFKYQAKKHRGHFILRHIDIDGEDCRLSIGETFMVAAGHISEQTRIHNDYAAANAWPESHAIH